MGWRPVPLRGLSTATFVSGARLFIICMTRFSSSSLFLQTGTEGVYSKYTIFLNIVSIIQHNTQQVFEMSTEKTSCVSWAALPQSRDACP